MDARQAYDFWASLYDSNKNNTRDLEAFALRDTIREKGYRNCLEIGCGTGKNTQWLADKCNELTAVDFSIEMLARAREKITDPKVRFIVADIIQEWDFATVSYDLVTFSLVLEHVEFLQPVLKKTFQALEPGGVCYIGELHPFKQYTGTRARFDTETGRQVVDCFNHHVSDFTGAAIDAGFQVTDLKEYFDTADHNEIPRILVITAKKPF
ncbi:MAG: class I SAM-dependent methyltransferase [Sphingobacteriales bacterium]|nr:MAG: class I SAM-dependent methyltransferase [Sphingobacteriales bacterium]